jgi:hypothetical protein
MDINEKPMETIQQWQDWYRSHRGLPLENEDVVSKDSVENLNETFAEAKPETDLEVVYLKQRAKGFFADTIAEFQNELTAQELFQSFKEAVIEQHELNKQQFERTQELLGYLHGSSCKKACEKK